MKKNDKNEMIDKGKEEAFPDGTPSDDIEEGEGEK